MTTTPFSLDISLDGSGIPSQYSSHTVRRLSALRGYYQDGAAYEAVLTADDPLQYEVYGIDRPEDSGEMPFGITIIYPGQVGDEYTMTKGHFHAVLATGEVYYCLRGHGMMVMETPEGDWNTQEMTPGRVVYVLPRWAHRTVNISLTEPLVFVWVFPGHAGHDYATIEKYGFRKLVVARDGQPTVVDNPRWLPPEAR
jgi:glucose-6-phosphate isomerase